MKTITVSMLREKGACEKQVELFKELFGESVEVTEELCVQYSDRFDFGWVARAFLSAAARTEYDRVRDAARAEYERVMAQTWARCYNADGSLEEGKL